MDPKNIGEAVEIYRGMRLEQRRLDRLPESCTPRDTFEAYELQNALNARLADLDLGAVSGHKIGCTTKVMQEYLIVIVVLENPMTMLIWNDLTEPFRKNVCITSIRNHRCIRKPLTIGYHTTTMNVLT